MVRTFLKIAFWVFSIIGVFLMLASFILFALSINSYIISTGITSSESEYKVSYNEVENAVKSRNASDNRDIHKKPQEDIRSIPELHEKSQDEEEQLINEIRKSLKAGGIRFYEAYLEQLRQFMKHNISDKNVRIEYFKGLKAIVELAPIQDINTYIEEYHKQFMEKYQAYLNKKIEHRELAIIFLSVGFACFITSLMFSMVVALLSIERNTSEMLSQIKPL